MSWFTLWEKITWNECLLYFWNHTCTKRFHASFSYSHPLTYIHVYAYICKLPYSPNCSMYISELILKCCRIINYFNFTCAYVYKNSLWWCMVVFFQEKQIFFLTGCTCMYVGLPFPFSGRMWVDLRMEDKLCHYYVNRR